MIGLLRGTLVEKQPNRLIVDVNGVGYEVWVPLSTFYHVPDTGGEVLLRVHTHVREDALTLFGFLTTLEQQIFERLIAISGIGPKLALAVLSGIDSRDLVRAVQLGDSARLTTIPGVGRKTAERITLELKDRLGALGTLAAGAPSADGDMRADLLSALLNLGYHRPLAERAIDAALKAPGDAVFEGRLKQALRELVRRG